ncbi:hypothetical protein H9P43_002831 [Blastocladiella emersonii ATCC 22665]|nr:hypothetical protein H9P43_002831 [Blastocladiella emersonii ATCC 22665]
MSSTTLASGVSHSPLAELTSHIFPPPEFAIVGAGVAGLTTAALLERARIPYVILERRKEGTHLEGSDLGLFPAAVRILSDLGFNEAYWHEHSSVVEHVHLCRARSADEQQQQPGLSSPRHANHNHRNSYHLDSAALRAAQAQIHAMVGAPPLKTLNMEKVLGPGQFMRMTNRRSLMTALQRMVPRSKILFDTSVIQCTENENHVELVFTHRNAISALTVPVVLGADGVKSVCRQLIEAARQQRHPADAAAPPPPLSAPRYVGEICFRGSFALNPDAVPADDFQNGGLQRRAYVDEQHPAHATVLRHVEELLLKDDFHKPASMSLYYDRDRRFSFGFLNETGSLAYWWVREKWAGSRDEFRALQRKLADKPDWPEPLRSMYALTRPADFYLQPIVDREHDAEPEAWHSHRCVLLGDAAHPATPALFQGANLAIEDAHLLVHLIASHPPTVAPATIFHQFAAARIKHVSRIQRESFRQSKVSQWDSKPSVLLRDAVLKLVPARLIESKLRKASTWDPATALRDVVAGSQQARGKHKSRKPSGGDRVLGTPDSAYGTLRSFASSSTLASSYAAGAPPALSSCSPDMMYRASFLSDMERGIDALDLGGCPSPTVDCGSPRPSLMHRTYVIGPGQLVSPPPSSAGSLASRSSSGGSSGRDVRYSLDSACTSGSSTSGGTGTLTRSRLSTAHSSLSFDVVAADADAAAAAAVERCEEEQHARRVAPTPHS